MSKGPVEIRTKSHRRTFSGSREIVENYRRRTLFWWCGAARAD